MHARSRNCFTRGKRTRHRPPFVHREERQRAAASGGYETTAVLERSERALLVRERVALKDRNVGFGRVIATRSNGSRRGRRQHVDGAGAKRTWSALHLPSFLPAVECAEKRATTRFRNHLMEKQVATYLRAA